MVVADVGIDPLGKLGALSQAVGVGCHVASELSRASPYGQHPTPSTVAL